MGLPGGIEIRDRWNRDSGGPWIAHAITQTTGSDYVDGRDGGRPGYARHTRRICPALAAADLGRIILWTLLVAASSLPRNRSALEDDLRTFGRM